MGHWRMQSGQVGIIILLIVVVMSTIGLSVVSRTSTDVNISKTSEDANRALNAAESGVEKALSSSQALDPTIPNQVTGTVNTIPNINVNYTVDKLRTLEATVDEGNAIGLDVRGVPNGSSSLDLYWAKETSCNQNPASLIITIYAQTGTSPSFRKLLIGACTKSPDDGFTIQNSGGQGYFRYVSVPLLTTDAFVRIRAVYNQTALRVSGVGWTLPIQQFRITATGQTTDQQNKAIQVDRSLPLAPNVFDYTLYTGGTLSN